VPVPELAVDATAEVVSRLPLPAPTSWIHSVRKPVLMKTDRAMSNLKWKPEYTSKATLKEMVDAHRAAGPAAR
jgi:nucleoside-diphosphate-sugar epimerase